MTTVSPTTNTTTTPVASNATTNVVGPSPSSFLTTTTTATATTTEIRSRQVCLAVDATCNLKYHFSKILDLVLETTLNYLYVQPLPNNTLTSHHNNPHAAAATATTMRTVTGTMASFEALSHRSGSIAHNDPHSMLAPVEFGLVLFQDHPPFSDFLVKSVPFSTDFQKFMSRIKMIPFDNGATIETAVADGLASSLYDMDWRADAEKFCILVCMKAHKDVPCMSLLGDCEGQMATQVAKLFAQENIQLSVISPMDSDIMREVFNQASMNGLAPEQILDCKSLFKTDMLAMLRGIMITEWSAAKRFSQTQAAALEAKAGTGVAAQSAMKQQQQQKTTAGALSSQQPEATNIVKVESGETTPMAPTRSTPPANAFGSTMPAANRATVSAQQVSASSNQPQSGTHPKELKSVVVHECTLTFVGESTSFSIEMIVRQVPAFANAPDFEQRVAFSKWPKEIRFSGKLPEMKSTTIQSACKENKQTLCLWEPKNPEKSERFAQLLKSMHQKDKVIVQQLTDPNDTSMKCLIIFPYATYTNKQQAAKECQMISCVVDKPYHPPTTEGPSQVQQQSQVQPSAQVSHIQPNITNPSAVMPQVMTNPAMNPAQMNMFPSMMINQQQLMAQMQSGANPFFGSVRNMPAQMTHLGQLNQLAGQMGQMPQMSQMGPIPQMSQMGQMGQMPQMNQMQMNQLSQMGQLNQMGQMGGMNPMMQQGPMFVLPNQPIYGAYQPMMMMPNQPQQQMTPQQLQNPNTKK